LALITVGPEARPGALGLGSLDFEEAAGFAGFGLPLGFAADWAKPAMAKLNPNISVIAVFFMISTSIVKSEPLQDIRGCPFRVNLLCRIDWSTFYENFFQST
jgi:hypothetical protein